MTAPKKARKITDKERLDWLTKHGEAMSGPSVLNKGGMWWCQSKYTTEAEWGKSPRAAIDAAIRKGGRK